MRQITKESIDAFNNSFTFNKQNTSVEFSYGKTKELPSHNDTYLTKLKLHGNTIAIKSLNKHTGIERLFINNCGWFTPTTKERLNALEGVNIQQNNFIWYLNGKEWNGELTEIKQ
jgi:hypothetical protein